MDAQQIYDNFHGQAQGTAGLSAAQQAAQRYAANSQDRATAIQQLVGGVQEGWTGVAAEAAAQGLRPYGVNALDTQQQLSLGKSVIEDQMNYFQITASQVCPVPPAPQITNPILAIATGQDPTSVYQQITQYNAVENANIDAYNQYVCASEMNTLGLPSIPPVSNPGGSVTVVSPSSAGTSSGVRSSAQAHRAASLSAPPAEAMSPTSPSPAGPDGQPAPASPGGSTSTAPSSSGAPTPPAPPGLSPPNPGSSVPPDQPGEPNLPVTGVIPGSAGPVPVGFGSGPDADRPMGNSSRSVDAGTVGFLSITEPGPWSEPGQLLRAQPISPGGDPEAAPRSGIDAQAMSRNDSLATASPGGRTGELAETGPVPGGRRALADEDDEYTSSYLEAEDGDELFGSGGTVVPAVIGESVIERMVRYRGQQPTR